MSTIKRACCQCGADYRFPIWQRAPKVCEGCFLPLAWERWEVEERTVWEAVSLTGHYDRFATRAEAEDDAISVDRIRRVRARRLRKVKR